MIGPCFVSHTVIVRGFSFAILIVSCRVRTRSLPASESTSASSIFSTTRSVTSGPRFVIPHAMFWLCPMTTPGSPEKENPETSNGHSGPTVRQRSPT